MEAIIKFFKSLLMFDNDDGMDIIALISKAKEIAELYAAVSGDPRAKSAILLTSLVFDAADKLRNPETAPEDRLNTIDELVKAIKDFD